MAFQYRYRISVDEDIIRRYNCRLPVTEGIVRFAIEMRSNFMAKGRSDYERFIDSERYAVPSCREEIVRHDMVLRLKHYWMADHQIEQLINEALLFAKRIAAAGRRGKIPIAVDLGVYTLQQEGETIEATVERAMRPEYLPPLYLCPAVTENPNRPVPEDKVLTYFLMGEVEAAVRVVDVEKALGIMEICVVCRRRPMLGTQISSLRCGHAFHCHCIVRWLEDDKCCPICRCPPYDQPKPQVKVKRGQLRECFTLDCHDCEVPGEVWNRRDDFLN